MFHIQKKDKPNSKYHLFESETTLCRMPYSDLSNYVLIDIPNKNIKLCESCRFQLNKDQRRNKRNPYIPKKEIK